MNYPACDFCGEGPNCPRHDLDRFQVRLVHLSATAIEYGLPPTAWRVVDTEDGDKSVPFGRYQDRARAEARADRENRKAAEAHEHTPGAMKFNGGNPVFLCATCRAIVWWAEQIGPHTWVPGERYPT